MPRLKPERGVAFWATLAALAVLAFAAGRFLARARPSPCGRTADVGHAENARSKGSILWAAPAAALFVIAAAGGIGWRLWSQEAKDRARAVTFTGGNPDRAPHLLRAYGCSGCHVVPGLRETEGRQGPPLRDIGRRAWLAGVLPNDPDTLVRFIVDPRGAVPQIAMPRTGIDQTQARDVAAYLLLH